MSSIKIARERSRTSTPVESTELATDGQQMPDAQWDAMSTILNAIYDYRTEDGSDPSKLFHRKVNKRVIPEYYETIKEPIALSTIKAKINTRVYANFAEFVRDFALIPHNAQVFNRPDSGAFQDALVIKEQLESHLQLLVKAGTITKEVAQLPDLGEIPTYEEPEPGDGDGEQDEEEESEEEAEADEDEEEEGDEEDVPKRKRGRPRGALNKKEPVEENTEGKRARGRPPRLLTPEEARIQAILKGIRKPKNSKAQYMISHFERLPDKQVMPEYYTEVKQPMAFDVLKKKVKRKKYKTLEDFMIDVNLMFNNAKNYNTDESQIYKDAVALQIEAGKLYDTEKAKPDDDFADDEGKIPMPNGVLHNGELHKVGDWVHIQNPNDLTKPIPGQIYRTYKAPGGQQMVNVCWYYRPEWTIHRFDKHFLPSEVVKTGRYKDHTVEEVEGKCFIMFFTRFFKGRPRGLPQGADVYVCEARYNETLHQFNKIKTWASCLPDEVRDKDYEMDLFEHPRRMKKLPSPIAYLLKDDQKETDELPKPQWGIDGAPPKIGAVHRRPRGEKDSPPPEPTPPPAPKPPTPSPRTVPPTPSNYQHTPSMQAQQSTSRPNMSTHRPSSLTASHPQSYAHPTVPSASVHRPPSQSTYIPQTPQSVMGRPSGQSHNYQHTPSMSNHPAGYPPRPPASTSHRDPPPIETYVLPDHANLSIPYEIRERYHQDDAGRVLFFTAPPVPNLPEPSLENDLPRRHSIHYLAEKARRKELISQKRKQSDILQSDVAHPAKVRRNDDQDVTRQVDFLKVRALALLEDQLAVSVATELEPREIQYLSAEQDSAREQRGFMEVNQRRRSEARHLVLGVDTGIYLDDWDNRLV